MAERPWELLADAAAPRALPPSTRAVLETLLLDRAGTGDTGYDDSGTDRAVAVLGGAGAARPLPDGLRERLATALPVATAPGQARARAVVVALVAAAAAAVLAVSLVTLPRQHRREVVAGPSAATPAPTGQTGSATSGIGLSAGAGSAPGPTPHPSPTTVARTPDTAMGAAAPPALTPASPAAAAPPAPAVPAVTALSPNHGPTAGGTWVTVSGTGLTGTTRVTFGGTEATRLQAVSDHQLRALSPAHLPGQVDVQVTTRGGTSPTTPADRYLYLA